MRNPYNSVGKEGAGMHSVSTRPPGDLTLAKEHAVLRRLMTELRGICTESPKTGVFAWVDRLRDRFEHFEAHYIRHMALEEKEGYLAPVLNEARPTLDKEIARLQAEHPQFITMMASIRAQMLKLAPSDALLIRDLCARLAQLLGYIEQHEQEEDLLLIDGVNRDIGVKD
jgi:hemerythrin-like domain-containing protein